jgi:predicted DNA-binding transcriptional regulator YafY
MPRSNRLFEIIQIVRSANRPVTADDLARDLEVSARTIYRDIAALQSMQTPIEGEAGIGYIMRKGYDLPPLNFDQEEIEALRVGLMLLTRTSDSMLQRAAQRICDKIDALHGSADWLQVTPWGAPSDDPRKGCVPISMLRAAIRDELKLSLTYCDKDDRKSVRTIRPVAMIYHMDCVLLAGWCELRGSFRHFRTDRIHNCRNMEQGFSGESESLRSLWLERIEWDRGDPAVLNQA